MNQKFQFAGQFYSDRVSIYTEAVQLAQES